MTRKELILATLDDLVADFCYYDRKEDEELGLGEIENAIEAGQITVDEIVSDFRDALQDYLEQEKES